MGRPSYDEETRASYFHGPAAALFDDPVVGATLRRIRDEDPDLLEAVAEVDRSLLRDSAALTPWQRLLRATAQWNAIMRLRGD